MTKNIKNRLTAIVGALSVLGSTQVFAAGASEPGLPQLDIDTWPSQLFWLVVLFGAGYLVMAKMVTPRIGAVLEERRKTLDGDLEKARIEAGEYAKQAAAEAVKKVEEADAKTAQKLAKKVAKAEDKLAEAKTSAMMSLNDVAAEAAVSTVVALTGIKATSAEAGKAVSSVAAKLSNQEAK